MSWKQPIPLTPDMEFLVIGAVRYARGRAMQRDPVIRECYSTSHYITPRRDMNIAEWCDWEEEARRVNRPRINQHGRELLAQLEQEEQCEK